jgi:TolB-like protein
VIMKLLKTALICLLGVCFFPEITLAQQPGGRPVVAVLGFEAENITRAEVQEYTDYLSYTLRQSQEYRVIDREQREQILREREFGREERSDDNYQKRIGTEIGADRIITGRIRTGEDGYTVEVKLIEIERGRTLNRVSKVYADSQELFDDCPKLIRELFRERVRQRQLPQYDLGVGFLSGVGFLRDEPDNSFSWHIPAGVYIEYIYPRGTVFIYTYYGFARELLLAEMSYGYRFDLFERVKFAPFAGISLYAADPEEYDPRGWIAGTGGLNLEFIIHRKSNWKLNVRTGCNLAFSDGERWINPLSDALLYFVISTGYTL